MTNFIQRYDTPAAKDELFGFLIAGHETTSTTVTWGLKVPHRPPTSAAKAATHIAFPPSQSLPRPAPKPSVAEIVKSQIPYLDATLEEILRCGQTAAGAMRVAKCDTDVLGYHIPKGTDVFCMANGAWLQEWLRSPWTRPCAAEAVATPKDRTGVWDVTDMKPVHARALAHAGRQRRSGVRLAGGAQYPPSDSGRAGCFGKCSSFSGHASCSNLFCCPCIIYADAICLVGQAGSLPKSSCASSSCFSCGTSTCSPRQAELNNYRAVDKVMHQPQQCFVRLAPAK
jgi:hypothetical protein